MGDIPKFHCALRKAERAADDSGCEPSSTNCLCTLATGWSDELGANCELARPQEAKTCQQRQNHNWQQQLDCHTNHDTTQWAPVSSHVWTITIPRGGATSPLMQPAMLRVAAGVERAEIIWARPTGSWTLFT